MKCNNVDAFQRIIQSPNTSLVCFDAFPGPRTLRWCTAIQRDDITVFKYLKKRTRATDGSEDVWYPFVTPNPPKRKKQVNAGKADEADTDDEDSEADEADADDADGAWETAADGKNPKETFYAHEKELVHIMEKLAAGMKVYKFSGKIREASFGAVPGSQIKKKEKHFILQYIADEAKRRFNLTDEDVKIMCAPRNDFPDLKDPDVEWLVDLLLVSSKVALGINFTAEHFEAVFVSMTRNGANVRECIQGMWRPRRPKTGHVYVYTQKSAGGRYYTVHRRAAELIYDLCDQFILGERHKANRDVKLWADGQIVLAKKYTEDGYQRFIRPDNFEPLPSWMRELYVAETIERGINAHFLDETQDWYFTKAGFRRATPEEVAAERPSPVDPFSSEGREFQESKENELDQICENREGRVALIEPIIHTSKEEMDRRLVGYKTDEPNSDDVRMLKLWSDVLKHTNLCAPSVGDIESTDYESLSKVFTPFAYDLGMVSKMYNAVYETRMLRDKIQLGYLLAYDGNAADSRDMQGLRSKEIIGILNVLGLRSSWDTETTIPRDSEKLVLLQEYLAEMTWPEKLDATAWKRGGLENRWQRSKMTRYDRVAKVFSYTPKPMWLPLEDGKETTKKRKRSALPEVKQCVVPPPRF